MDSYALSNLFDSYLPFGIIESPCFDMTVVTMIGALKVSGSFLLQEIHNYVNINGRTGDTKMLTLKRDLSVLQHSAKKS